MWESFIVAYRNMRMIDYCKQWIHFAKALQCNEECFFLNLRFYSILKMIKDCVELKPLGNDRAFLSYKTTLV